MTGIIAAANKEKFATHESWELSHKKDRQNLIKKLPKSLAVKFNACRNLNDVIELAAALRKEHGESESAIKGSKAEIVIADDVKPAGSREPKIIPKRKPKALYRMNTRPTVAAALIRQIFSQNKK